MTPRASILIAMGTAGLVLVTAAPAGAEDSKPKQKDGTTTLTNMLKKSSDTAQGITVKIKEGSGIRPRSSRSRSRAV